MNNKHKREYEITARIRSTSGSGVSYLLEFSLFAEDFSEAMEKGKEKLFKEGYRYDAFSWEKIKETNKLL